MVADRQGHDDPDAVPTIAALFRAHMDETGDSYGALARRTGDVISRQQLWKIAKQPIKEFPEPATILAVAAALNIDVTAVVLGYAASIGLDVRRSGSGIILPQHAGRLPDQQKKLVRNLVRDLLEAQKTPEQTAAPVISRKRAQHDAAKQPQPGRHAAESDDQTADG